MIASDAVAALRPRPSGPPLRGRAPLRDGIRNTRPFWPPEHGTGNRRFHLKLAVPWSKIGGRRSRNGLQRLRSC
jgi:hypothetical protein